MVRVKLVTKYPISYVIDREKVELTADGKSGYASVTSKPDVASGKFVIETESIEVRESVSFGKKIPTDGLVLEFPIFEGAGTVLHDTSGYNNHGTIYGAVWKQLATGKWTLKFDGVDDKVLVDPSASLDSIHQKQEITVIAWVRLRKALYRAKVVSRRVNIYTFWFIGVDGRKPYCGHGNGNTLYTLHSPFDIPLNEWHCLGFKYSYKSKKTVLYYDGESIAEREVDIKIGDLTNVKVSLGSDFQGTENFFAGDIGLGLVYSKELSDQKIEKIYKATAPLFRGE